MEVPWEKFGLEKFKAKLFFNSEISATFPFFKYIPFEVLNFNYLLHKNDTALNNTRAREWLFFS